MERWLTTLYERDRVRYVRVCGIACALEVMLIVIPVAAFFPSRYEGLSTAQFLAVLGAAELGAIIVFGGIIVVLQPQIRAVMAWSRDRSEELAPAARVSAFDGPRRAGRLAIGLGASISPLVVAVIATPRHHTQLLDWLELMIGAVVAAVLAGLNSWFILEVLLAPLRAELLRPADGARRASLIARLALTIPVLTWVAGFAVGYLTTSRATAGAGHLLVVYGIAVAGTVVCLVALMPLFAGGLMGPIRDLTRATRAVAAGRLDTRIPVTTTDELGELAKGFNQMLDELQLAQRRTVTASDDARRAVERDLHDGAQQRLVLVKLKVGLLERDRDRRDLVAEIGEELSQALADLRDLARGIYPPLLESDGLPGALRDAVERAAIPARLNCDGTGRYAPELEAAVYFCCLEALQNAAKHAGSDARAEVRLAESHGRLVFAVSDDGRGFDPSAVRGASGIQNMGDRLGALGGELRIDSAPGEGTTVTGAVPLGER